MNSRIDNTSPETILRLADLVRMTGLSRSTLYKRIEKGQFPRQISLGARVVGWLTREVNASPTGKLANQLPALSQ